MKKLKLYPEGNKAHFETLQSADLDANCTNCALHKDSTTVCMGADATDYDASKPSVQIVMGAPTAQDDQAGRPFSSTKGKFIRRYVSEKYPDKSVIYEHSVKCYAGKKDLVSLNVINTCPSYLKGTYLEAKPERIIAVGKTAILSILGRSLNPQDIRKGFAFTSNGTPIYLIADPTMALLNRFHRANWEEDFDWAMTGKVPNNPVNAVCQLVENVDDAKEAIKKLTSTEWFAFDVETAGVMFNKSFTVLCLSASTPTGETFVWTEEALKDKQVIANLKACMEDPNILKVGQNLKYDIASLRCAFGIEMQGFHGDTLIWTKMMESDVRAGLDILGEKVGMGGHKEEAKAELDKAKKFVQKAQRDYGSSGGKMLLPGMLDPILTEATETGLEAARFAYAYIKRDTLYRYNGRDSLSTALLAHKLEKQIKDQDNLNRIWNDVVKHATPALEQVEAWGMPFSSSKNTELVSLLNRRTLSCKQALSKYGQFNPDSTKELQDLLFNKLKLAPVKYTSKGAPSTDVESLNKLKNQHEIIQHLLEWRKISKIYGTYAVGLQKHVREDGRIHPNIKITGTRTGRLSCNSPNLQQVPSTKTEEGKLVKSMFEASPGYKILDCDFSQLELRIAAMLSKDPLMKEIFVSGQDYHQRTAELISRKAWGIDPEDVTPVHRGKAKTTSFGVLYGMTSRTLSQNLNCSVNEAQMIMDALFGSFSKLAEWCDEQKLFVRRNGVAHTWWNGYIARKRDLWAVGNQDEFDRGAQITALNSAVNMPVQGTGAEYTLASVIKMVDWLNAEKFPAKLVITVHDSLVFEVREDCVDELAYKCLDVMQGWPPANGYDVPIIADAQVGDTWGTMEDWNI